MSISSVPKQLFDRPLRPISNGTRDNLSLDRNYDREKHRIMKRAPIFARHVGRQRHSEASSDHESAVTSKDLTKRSEEKPRVGKISVEEILATGNLAGLPPGYRPVYEEWEENGSSHDSIVNSDDDDIAAEDDQVSPFASGIESHVWLPTQGFLDTTKETLGPHVGGRTYLSFDI